eukprot:maker-scaffold_1-augustus-gene-32.40-mRNA-1 protein AED:0.27 eAED:0.29 QI:0/0/0/1/1/1/2/0/693
MEQSKEGKRFNVLFQLREERYHFCKIIHDNANSNVILCANEDSSKLVVLKRVKLDTTPRLQSARNEMKTLQRIKLFINDPRSKFLLISIFSKLDEDKICFGFNFCQGGDLYNLLYDERLEPILDMFCFFDLLFYIGEICLALQFLHSKGILHGDIKPGNVLIDRSGHLKLTDFGTSQILIPKDLNQLSQLRNSSRETLSSFSSKENLGAFDVAPAYEPIITSSGTVPYCAPEVLTRKAHCFQPDIWSFGVLCCELITGGLPFETMEEICYSKAKTLVEDRLTFPSGLEAQCKDFVNKFFERSLCARIRSEDVFKHQLFELLDIEKLKKHEYQPPFIPEKVCPQAEDTHFLCLDPRSSNTYSEEGQVTYSAVNYNPPALTTNERHTYPVGRVSLSLDMSMLNTAEIDKNRRTTFMGAKVFVRGNSLFTQQQWISDTFSSVAGGFKILQDKKMYQTVKTLGKGASGKVNLERNIVTNELEVWKRVSGYEARNRPQVLNEINILQTLRTSKFTGQFLRSFFDEGDIVICTKVFPGESLKSFLTRGILSPARGIEICRQILLALMELRQRQVLHRDIKPANILVSVRVKAQLLVNIIDFGLAKVLEDENDRCMTKCGTIKYLSPERQEGRPYSYPADIYSFGLVAAEILRFFEADASMKQLFTEVVQLAVQQMQAARPSPYILLHSPLFMLPVSGRS